MPNKPRLQVTQQSTTGRNKQFQDTKTGNKMSRAETVKKIENGPYADKYHVRTINGVKTPVSNPDGSTNNNLG